MQPCGSAILLLALCCLLGSCSFQREWREAVAARPVPATDFTGPWSGTWHSQPTGHSGKLRAIITPAEGTAAGEPGLYEFYYHATWATILRAGFRASFEVEQEKDGVFRVSGEHALGRRGRYRQDATLTSDRFDATYDAGIDQGTMVLRRP